MITLIKNPPNGNKCGRSTRTTSQGENRPAAQRSGWSDFATQHESNDIFPLLVTPNSKDTYSRPSDTPSFVVREDTIEYGFIGKLQSLKYEYREDIRDRAALEKNFREKFEALNRVRLTDGEFPRLLESPNPAVNRICAKSRAAPVTFTFGPVKTRHAS